MHKYGLIGKSLRHSYSKIIFDRKFKSECIMDSCYDLYELSSIDELPRLIRDNPDLCGFNVTNPYKKQILPFLDGISPDAAEIGAVNTVKIIDSQGDRKLIGYNTDFSGFESSLHGASFEKAMVLGSGGAASAVVYALHRIGCACVVVSRKNQEYLKYNKLDVKIFDSVSLIVNCTPLGMFPDMESLPPIPYEHVKSCHFVYDLVYNPPITAFLKECAARGATVKNGLEMLQKQAAASWLIWTNNQK